MAVQSTCKECGRQYNFYEVRAGICTGCVEKAEQKASAEVEKQFAGRVARMIVTTEMAPNLAINERLGIVGAQCAQGMSIFKDIFISGRDLWGGRSDALQQEIQAGREIAIRELTYNAAKVGADAVIAVSLSFSEFSGGGSKMLFIAATGTAISLKSDS